MVWSDEDWLNSAEWSNEEAQKRLEDSGYVIAGWLNGKPQFIGEVDWETIQDICLGNAPLDVETKGETADELPSSGSKRRKRK